MLGRSLALSYIHGVRINNEALPFHCGLPRSRPSLPRFPPDRKWQHCLTAPCPFPLLRVLACLRVRAPLPSLYPHMPLAMRCCHGICFAAGCKKEGEPRRSVLLFRESNVLANDANIGQAKAKVPRFSESLSSQLALNEVLPAFFPN